MGLLAGRRVIAGLGDIFFDLFLWGLVMIVLLWLSLFCWFAFVALNYCVCRLLLGCCFGLNFAKCVC